MERTTSSPGSPIRVVLALKRLVVRRALGMLLEQAPGISLVGEAGTTEEALHLIGQERPDVVVCANAPPDIDPPEVAGRMAAEQRERTRMVVLTNQTDHARLIHLLKAPVAGCLHTDVSAETLVFALRAAYHGLLVFDEQAGQVVREALQADVAELPGRLASERLTPREVQVLALMKGGLANKEIAARLGLRVRTVEVHVANIVGKLKVRTRTEAVITAVRAGNAADGLTRQPPDAFVWEGARE